jgi:hypothetical protein
MNDNSKKIEKEELEKKYYSQKKEIKTKINTAKKALVENVKEAEEDYKKVVEEEPDLLSEEDKKSYKEYLETEKKQLKESIEMLEKNEQELELDYEDLKTEPKENITLDYAKEINHAVKINSPLMKMVFDYFNFLNDNKEAQEKSKVLIDCFMSESGAFASNFPHNANMEHFKGSVIIHFKSTIRIIVTLRKFFENNEFHYRLGFFSEGKTNLNPDYVSKKILFNAIAHSKVKGTYITLPPQSIMWNHEKLEKRGFEDIFLPTSIMQDLKLYTTLFDKTGKLLRYLMIGNPGTGKTESTLAIANYLKDANVTVIKTMVCDSLKEKIELAELLAPSIIIFDDIDLSLGSRKKGGVSHGLAQFLDVLDGTDKVRKDVGFIATTNSLELLDMAAQRPGRFDKLLSFDSLTKSNIKNIILKSIYRNFDLSLTNEDGTEITDLSVLEEIKPFIDESVINKLHTSKVTGAHIYNTIKMLKLRIQTLELENIDSEWIVKEITTEIDQLARIRKTDYLQATLPGSQIDVSFPMRNDVEEDEAVEEEVVAKTRTAGFSLSEVNSDSEVSVKVSMPQTESESGFGTEKSL